MAKAFGILAASIAFAAVMTSATLGWASPIALYDPNANPTTEGWTQDGSGSNGSGTETTASGTYGYWQYDQTNSAPGSFDFARQDLTASQLTSDWTYSVDMRVISAPQYVDAQHVLHQYGTVTFYIDDGISRWGLYFTNNTVGTVPFGGTNYSHVFNMNTTSDYHDYSIQFHHNGPGTADDTASFFVDGSQIFANLTRTNIYTVSDRYAEFGTLGLGDANFNFACLTNDNTCTLPDHTTPPPPAVPTPGTLPLLALGLALVTLRKSWRLQIFGVVAGR